MSFDEKLEALIWDDRLDTKSTVLAIKQLILESLPEEKNIKDCDCGYHEGCGCAIQDFNDYRQQALKNMEIEQ